MSDYARYVREARRNARELELAAKEQLKSDERAYAKHLVAAYENQIQLLISLHKECGEQWNWFKVPEALAPIEPAGSVVHESRFRQTWELQPVPKQTSFETKLAAAKEKDRAVSRAAQERYLSAIQKWRKKVALAARIPARDLTAYMEALQEFSPLAELEELGAEMEFTMHSASLFECVLAAKNSSVIPSEIKSLTSTGKLSAKAMPRARFHEIYQDYVCSAILRIARELFAMLPIEHAIITATAAVTDLAAGMTAIKPVLSVVICREDMKDQQWEFLDPSDAIARMTHRGDFKATRKSGAFQPIVPFRPDILNTLPATDTGIGGQRMRAIALRGEIQIERVALLERISS